jgi:hypothetical protein
MNRTALLLALCTFGLALAGTESIDAQRGRRNRLPESDVRLAAATSLTCAFPASAAGKWTDGTAQAEVASRPNPFTLTITHIDTQEGTGQATGLGAPAEVTVKLVGANLHILDIRQNGALGITTIFGDETQNGRLKAVHSRSEYASGRGAAGAPAVAQYYGDCELDPR